jgi:anti-anti-sigma regulatory factor
LVITISIIGRFDVSTYSEVSRAFTLYSYQNPRYVIDLSKTGRVHDFGIGMLLLLRERLGERRIEIIGCRRDIQQKLIYFGLEGLLKATNGSHAA